MFIDKLGVTIAAQQHTKVVKPGHDALKLDAVDEKNRQRYFLFADMIEKRILQILGSFSGHFCSLCYVFSTLAHEPLVHGGDAIRVL